MRRSLAPFAAALLLTLIRAGVAAGGPLQFAVPQGVQVSVLLAPPGLRPKVDGASLAFDVDPDGLPVYADGAALKVFGSPRPLVSTGGATIDDFAWMRDGSLLMITKNHLAGVNASGLSLGPQLPALGMRVRPAGVSDAYVFGGASQPANRDVYLFSRDGRVAKLLSAPQPVGDVAGDGKTTFVAVGTILLRLDAGKKTQVLLRTHTPIVSIAIAPRGLFYSTRSSVGYLDEKGGAHDFLRGQGGLLRTHGRFLFLLLDQGARIVRLGPVSAFIDKLNASAPPH